MGRIPRLVVKSFVSLIFATFFFLAGSLYDNLFLWYKKPVEVTIKNNSGQWIKSLNLTYTGNTTSGSIKIEPPKKEQSVLVKYFQSGEGSFTIEASLDNGKILRGNGGYVEAGYSATKTISPEGIN